jgi:Cys-tRNA(Pro)/Cys-tRNA(Cys) deacylase
MVKNNVTRMLESRGIPFQAFDLPVEKVSALETAQILGVEPDLIYKTIVVTRVERGKPILALVPAPREVDLKALARAVGEKKVHLASQKQAEQLTGLQVGGISPLALLQRGFQVVVDISAQSMDESQCSCNQQLIVRECGLSDFHNDPIIDSPMNPGRRL